MSLPVWLPLNGNLNNLGIAGSVMTTIGTNNEWNTNDSKISDSCLHLLKASGTISVPSMIGAKQMSIAYWVKVNNAWSEQWRDGIRWYSTDGSSDSYSRQEFYTNCTKIGFWFAGSPNSISGKDFTVGVWHHLVFVINYITGSADFYIDGSLVGHTAGVNTAHYIKTGDFTLGDNDGSGIDINMNDVRIYDHCLSALEVKELSQGLILHYQLNKPANINNNLYIGSEKFTGSWGNSSNWTTSTDTYGNFVVKQRSGTWGGLYQNIPCTKGDIFTISFYGKVDIGGNIQSVHRSNLGNVTTGLNIINGNFKSGTAWVTDTDDGTQWERYWSTIEIIGSDITYLQWRLENSVSGKNFYICGIKLEKGYVATPWSHASSEAGETNLIADCSGYMHNGSVKNGPLSLLLETPRYNACTHFSAKNQKIEILNFPTAKFGNSYSFAWWAKISSTDPMHWGFADGIRLNGLYSGNLWNTGDSSANPLYIPGTTTQVTKPTTNIWHHWVMTGNGTKCYVYQDGQLWGEAKTYKAISGSTIYINGWNTQTNYSSDNYSISDFRIYCTALSAADIKRLYEISMEIDNFGNILPRILV